MLAIRTSAGSSARGDPHRVRAQHALDAPRDDRVLLAVLGRAAAARRGGRRRPGRRCGASSRPARACSRAGPRGARAARGWRPTNAASPRPTQKHEAGRELLAQHAEAPPPGRARRGACTCDFAREHDLLQLARADQLDGARDRRLVVLGRHRAGDLEAAGRARVEQRQRRARAARRGAPRAARAAPRRSSSGRSERRRASADASPPRRASATSGTISDAGAKPAQCGAAPPSGANAKPPTATGAGAGGPSRGSRDGLGRERAPALGDAREAVAARAPRSPPTAPSAASATPSRSGCSKAEPLLAGAGARRRTTAVGSTPASSATVIARAPRRVRRARRTRRVQRAASRAAIGSVAPRAARRGRARGAAPPSAARSRRARARSRSRPCASSRSARTGGPCRSNASILSVVPGDLDRSSSAWSRRRPCRGRSRTICMTSRALRAVGGDLEQRELARDRLLRLEVADLEHVDQLVQLLGDLVDRVHARRRASA